MLVCVIAVAAPLASDTLADLRLRIGRINSGFHDLKANLVVLESNRRELEKMGKVFAETYQFKKASVDFKSPNKLKMEGALGMMKVKFVTAGCLRTVHIPSIRYRKQEDITDEHEKHMTSLDVGVVSESIWDTYRVSLIRTENVESQPSVYVLHLQTPTSKKSQMIWVEDGTFKLLRRDKLLDDGDLKVRTMYSEHKQFDGVWVPLRAEVFNGDSKRAAVTEMKDVAVNAGIDDEEFK